MTTLHPEPNITRWDSDFPHTSESLHTLKLDLHHADLRRHRTRLHLDLLESELDTLRIPPPHWSRPIRQTVLFLERRFFSANRVFQSALKLLVSLFPPNSKTAATRTAAEQTEDTEESEQSAPPPPPQKPPLCWTQIVSVSIVDGQTITKIVNGQPAEFLARTTYKDTDLVERFVHFEQPVPEEYTWVNTNDGNDYSPVINVFLYYSIHEFLRLTRLELDTNSPHLLDGERAGYKYQARPA